MRKALRMFAEKQEAILKENDYKNGWDNCSDRYLIVRALAEMAELHKAILSGGDIVRECCDVANFMMMIADNNKTEET